MSWLWKGVEFRDELIPENAVGFIYIMTTIIDGASYYYVGKKNFSSNRKKKLSKKKLSTDKRKKKYERVSKTDYQNYYSSNDVLKAAHKAGQIIRREIMKICYSKTELTYQEVKAQFVLGVLEDPLSLNANILGRFYKQKGVDHA